MAPGSLDRQPQPQTSNSQFQSLNLLQDKFGLFYGFMRIVSFPYKRSTRGLTLVCLNGHQNLAPNQCSDSVVQITHT